jgi:hypothetical protein
MPGLKIITKLFQPVRIHVLFASREYVSNDVIRMAIQIVTRDRLEILSATAELVGNAGSKSELIQSTKSFGERRVHRAGSDDSFSVDLLVGDLSSVEGTVSRWKTRIRIVSADRREYSCENSIKIASRYPVR